MERFLNSVVKARIQSNIPLSQSADHVGDPILGGWDIDRFYGQTSSGFDVGYGIVFLKPPIKECHTVCQVCVVLVCCKCQQGRGGEWGVEPFAGFEMHIAHCTVSIAHSQCPLHIVHCTVFIAHCTLQQPTMRTSPSAL